MEPFEDVYDRYFQDVFRFAYSMCGDTHLAEDIAQETFFKALRQMSSFRGECSVKSWLFQIARNDYLSRCRRDKWTTSLEDAPEPVQSGSVEERLDNRLTWRTFAEGLGGPDGPFTAGHNITLVDSDGNELVIYDKNAQ